MQNTASGKNKIQQTLINVIENTPGLHCCELSRQAKIPVSTLKYHLRCLEKQGAVMTDREGRCLHYYVTEGIGLKEKKILSVLRKEPVQRIIHVFFINGNMSEVDLSRKLQKDPTTIEFHLQKLRALEIIEPVTQMKQNGPAEITRSYHPVKNEIIYQLKEPEIILHLLQRYKISIFDETEDGQKK